MLFEQVKKNQVKCWLIPCLLSACLMSGCTSAGKTSNEEGLTAFYNGNYKEAVTLFNQAITQDASEAEYYVNRGMAQYKLAQYEEARLSFEAAVEKNSSLLLAYRGIGLCALKTGSYEEAITLFDTALSFVEKKGSDTWCDIVGYRAEAEYKKQDYEKAIESFQQLISYQYNPEEIYLRLGNAYAKLGNTEEALQSFQKSININHKTLSNYTYMIQTFQEISNMAPVETIQNAALSLEQKTAEEWFQKGLFFMEQKQDKEAFAAFELSYNMGYREAGYYLGYYYESWGEYEEAQNIYQKWMLEEPENAKLYNQLAICDIKREEYESALVWLACGLKLEQEEAYDDLLWNQAVCYEHLKQYEKAIGVWRIYLERNPTDEKANEALLFLQMR